MFNKKPSIVRRILLNNGRRAEFYGYLRTDIGFLDQWSAMSVRNAKVVIRKKAYLQILGSKLRTLALRLIVAKRSILVTFNQRRMAIMISFGRIFK